MRAEVKMKLKTPDACPHVSGGVRPRSFRAVREARLPQRT